MNEQLDGVEAQLAAWKTLAQRATKIQSGGQGTVVAIQDPADGSHVAVKYIAARERRARRAEVSALQRLENAHQHIVHTFGVAQGASGSAYIFQERAICDLHDAAGACRRRVMGEDDHVRRWMLQVADALRFCHASHVAHRDVKPENVLLVHPQTDLPNGPNRSSDTPTQLQATAVAENVCSGSALSADQQTEAVHQHTQTFRAHSTQLPSINTSTNQFTPCRQRSFGVQALTPRAVARLCDFGAAYIGKRDQPQAQHIGRTPCGSQYYCAPEVYRLMTMDSMRHTAKQVWPPRLYDWKQLQQAGYNPYAADVWSFGMMLFTLCSGLKPFASPCSTDPVFRAFVQHTQPNSAALDICGVHRVEPGQDTEHRQHDEDDGKILFSLWDRTPGWEWPPAVSSELRDLITSCLQLDPQLRISMEEPTVIIPVDRVASPLRSRHQGPPP